MNTIELIPVSARRVKNPKKNVGILGPSISTTGNVLSVAKNTATRR